MKRKRRSVFTILLLRIVIVVVLINSGLTLVSIQETIKIQKRNVELTRVKIQSEIDGLFDTWKAIFESLDQLFGLVLERTSNTIVDFQNQDDLIDVNLDELLILQGLDSAYVNIHVIQNGIVVNSTNEEELGTNFYNLEGTVANRMISALETGEFSRNWGFSYRMISREVADEPRVFFWSIQPTKDQKYIVFLSAKSETAEELVTMFSERMSRIKEENKGIIYINLHISDYIRLLNHPIPWEFYDDLVKRSFAVKEDVSEQINYEGRTLLVDNYYYNLEDKQWFMDHAVFSLITDITDHKSDVYKIIWRQSLIVLASLILLIGFLIIATRKFQVTLKDLLGKTTIIAKGNLNERVIVAGHNEFTTLAEQFNQMVQRLGSSQNELNQRNKEVESSNRTLQERNEEITSQNDEISAQRDEIEAQRDMVTEQKDQILEQKQAITDSIEYASRIQSAVLPPDEVIKYLLPKHFILYRPRDIVSGDFYWLTHLQGETIIAVADCTGHGVPGAFMSMLGIALLNEVVSKTEHLKANLILNELRDQVILSLRQSGKMEEAKDGMDISLCILNKESLNLQYAGANNHLYLIRKGELIEIKGDRMPIGISSKAGKSFTNHEMNLFKDDSLYMFSDGYADQFGGENRRKFMSKRLKQLLIEIQDNIMFDQKEILEQTINEWMGKTGKYEEIEQIDDMIVMGIKI